MIKPSTNYELATPTRLGWESTNWSDIVIKPHLSPPLEEGGEI